MILSRAADRGGATLGNIAGRGSVATACAAIFLLSAMPIRAQEPEFPVVVITGVRPGPTLALVAGVHGGKVAAVDALSIIEAQLRPSDLRGTVILLSPANVAGFRAGLAQTSPDDGLNLNRVFPGRADGSPTERLAERILRQIVARSDYLIDLHGSDGTEAVGTFAYVARPGIDPRVDSLARELAVGWGLPVIVWDVDGPRALEESRFLQTAAHLSGVPAMTLFTEGSTRKDASASARIVDGVGRVLRHLEMLGQPGDSASGSPLALPRRTVITAPADGAWDPKLHAGREIPRGELLGLFRDSLGVVDSVRAEQRSVVLHQRLRGPVSRGTPIVIFAVVPDSLVPSR